MDIVVEVLDDKVLTEDIPTKKGGTFALRSHEAMLSNNGETRRIKVALPRGHQGYKKGKYKVDWSKSVEVNNFGRVGLRDLVLVP
jgi:hypothetical protein